MEQVAVFNDVNGFASFIIPSPHHYVDGALSDKAKTQIVERALPADLRKNVLWVPRKDIDYLALQSGGRKLRDAWVVSGSKVEVSMPRARNIKMKQIRQQRDKKLAETDAEMTRVLEEGNPSKIAAVKIKRQKLRDLPSNVDLDSIKDAKALADLEPEELR